MSVAGATFIGSTISIALAPRTLEAAELRSVVVALKT